MNLGAGAINKLPPGIRKSKDAVAETIINNMRKVIIDEHALNPKFYDRMSELLDAKVRFATAYFGVLGNLEQNRYYQGKLYDSLFAGENGAGAGDERRR